MNPFTIHPFTRGILKIGASRRETGILPRPEHSLVMPPEEHRIGVIHLGRRQHAQRAAVILIVIPAILILLLDPAAYLDLQLRGHGEVSPVEENMEI